jgi:hypothetical protein
MEDLYVVYEERMYVVINSCQPAGMQPDLLAVWVNTATFVSNYIAHYALVILITFYTLIELHVSTNIGHHQALLYVL